MQTIQYRRGKRFWQNKLYIMEVSGRIKFISDIKNVTPTFRKKELVITTEEQYPQTLMIEFVQDRAELLNSYQVGQEVVVSINLRGREWTNPQGEVVYFTSIAGWRISPKQPAVAYGQPAYPPQQAPYGMPPQESNFQTPSGQIPQNQPMQGFGAPQTPQTPFPQADSFGSSIEEQDDDLPF